LDTPAARSDAPDGVEGAMRATTWGAVLATVAAMAALGWGAGAGAQGVRPGAPAPEIAGAPWINSEPLTRAGLRGRVVLVEFWTHG
jgi:hypothetical protein